MAEASLLSGIKHTEPPSGVDRLPSRQSHQLRRAHDAAAAKRRLDCNQKNIVNGNGNVTGNTLECSDGGEQSIWVIVLEVVGGIVVACIGVGCCQRIYCKQEEQPCAMGGLQLIDAMPLS